LNGIPSVAAKSAGAFHEFFNVRSQGAKLPEGAGRWQAASGQRKRVWKAGFHRQRVSKEKETKRSPLCLVVANINARTSAKS
jgi:hypothetical protein